MKNAPVYPWFKKHCEFVKYLFFFKSLPSILKNLMKISLNAYGNYYIFFIKVTFIFIFSKQIINQRKTDKTALFSNM